MRCLLDTCVFVWSYAAPEELSDAVADRLTDGHNQLYLSVVSLWELLIKQQSGRADAPGGDLLAIADEYVRTGFVQLLAVERGHVGRLPHLPDHHRDPWDRMLVCQAQAEGLTILTPDKFVHQYPVAWEW